MASKAEQLKDEGNKLFANKEWLKSAAKYTEALKADPQNAVLYSNRSAALLKLLKVSKALEDADMCIKLKPDWEKGYFRKGAIMEEQNKLSEAMDVYLVAQKLVPEGKELSHKIHTLRNRINKAASSKPSATQDTGKDGKDAVKDAKDASKGSKAAASKDTKDSSSRDGKQSGSEAKSKDSSDATQGGIVYEDLGSVEVARFAEEFLGVLRDDIEEGAVMPTVHFLPGRALASSEEQEAHVRCAGAFETPETLASCTEFLRAKGAQVQAKAALSIVPKSEIGFPRVWDKPRFPGGDRPGIFAQLETPAVRKLWFIPLREKQAETPVSADYDRFSLLPRLIKS